MTGCWPVTLTFVCRRGVKLLQPWKGGPQQRTLSKMEGGGHKIGHNRRIGDKSRRAELMLTPRKERIYRWSGWPDLNRRPHAPQACALPGCATPRPLDDAERRRRL